MLDIMFIRKNQSSINLSGNNILMKSMQIRDSFGCNFYFLKIHESQIINIYVRRGVVLPSNGDMCIELFVSEFFWSF